MTTGTRARGKRAYRSPGPAKGRTPRAVPASPTGAISKSLRLRRNGANGANVDDVYEQIWSAIIDNSLPPETRLVEERLCEIFGLGRTRLRRNSRP